MLFIAGHREISQKRFLELFKHYIKKDSITWGFLKEDFIEGFEGQPQFRAARLSDYKELIEAIQDKLQITSLHQGYGGQANYKIERSEIPKLRIIEYSQSELASILEEVKPSKAIFINGSWKIAFHRRPEFEILQKLGIEYSLKSPFCSEEEAREYSSQISKEVEQGVNALMRDCDNEAHNSEMSFLRSEKSKVGTHESTEPTLDSRLHGNDSEVEKYFLRLAEIASYQSFDYTWQTGAVLVQDGKPILFGHNKILPYEAWVFHHGATKEKNMSQMQDLSANDSLHAEMDIVSQVIRNSLSIVHCTLYITLMPCPNCARMLATLGLKRIVCSGSHSGGYAEGLFRELGVEVRLVS